MWQAKFLGAGASFHNCCGHWPPAELSSACPACNLGLMQKASVTVRQEIISIYFILWVSAPAPEIPMLKF